VWVWRTKVVGWLVGSKHEGIIFICSCSVCWQPAVIA
jgi:hypothetical protein